MPIPRPLRLAAVAAAACTSLAICVPAAATAAPAPRQTLLVLLRAPRDGTARAHALVARTQASVVAEVTGIGARVLERTTIPDTLTVQVTSAQARSLRVDPLVASVLPEAEIPGPADPALSLAATAHATSTHEKGAGPPAIESCGTFRHPQLDPEALAAINDVPGTTMGFDGKGVKVAFLADGLQISDRDFTRNHEFASPASPTGSHVIAGYEDFSGDGTARRTDGGEAFLDASSIAAQGNAVYDLSSEVSRAHPLPKGCDVRIVGAAPGATVDALKIFAASNESTSSGFVQAINWAVTHGVSVINESFGGNPFPDAAADVVRAADEAAVAAGVTVVASSGDAGVSGTIGSPATDPDVLSVGATTTMRAYQQDSFGGINLPGMSDRFVGDNISSLSSGGVAQDGQTVDLVAPGDLNWALCSTSHLYSDCSGKPIQLTGGTSESSPLTAGAAADVIEAYRSSHHGASPSPDLVMRILTSTATDLATPADQQGAGLLDVASAVRMALSIAGTTRTARPGGVLASATQLNLAGQPSSTVSEDVMLTNTASHVAHVTLGTRTLVPERVVSGAFELNPAPSAHLPTFPVWSGAPEVYRTVRLKVGAGVGRLQLQAAYPYTQQSSLLHVALFTPSGALAGYSNPQGIGDFADVEVARPAPGTWTAAFFTVLDGFQGDQGTTGRIPYTFTELRFAGAGTVSPASLTLAPGASRTVTFHDALPSTAGDTSTSIVLRSTAGASSAARVVTSIPVTLRTLVAISASGGRFRGVLTGGNGRGGAPGQTNTFDFSLPAGKTDVDVAVALSSNPPNGLLPADQLIGMLEDPNGNVVAYDTNYTVSSQGEVETRFLDLYATAPVAGTWQLALDWVQPVTGRRIATSFTGSVAFDQVSVSAALPDAVSSTIPEAGQQFTVTVHNTGVAPMILSPDARLTSTVPITLADATGVSATQRLGDANDSYFVPNATSTLAIDETATAPATFDASFAPGDPDLSPLVASPYVTEAWSPTAASISYSPPGGVSPGLWNVVQDGVGPYAASGVHGTETTTVVATTRAFDPAVTSSTPDAVESLTTGGAAFNPDIVAPGGTDQITITFTPTASVGTVVTGTLFLVGLTPGSSLTSTIGLTTMFPSELAAIPYEYTVAT